MQKYLYFLLIIFLGAQARADMGPKPSFSMTLVQPAHGPKLTIKTAKLLFWGTKTGKFEELPEYGPQGLQVGHITLSCLAYGFPKSLKIVATFSDGKTRSSNIFNTYAMDSHFSLEVKGNSLLIKEDKNGIPMVESRGPTQPPYSPPNKSYKRPASLDKY